MGAGAATLSDLPAQVDERTAKACAGDQFDEAAFTSAANDAGLVSKEDFLKAAAAAHPSSSDMQPQPVPAPAGDAIADDYGDSSRTTRHVLLHDPARWPQQRAALEEVCSIKTTSALEEVLKRTSHTYGEEDYFERGAFAGVGALAAALFKNDEEWWALLVYVADLALRSVGLFETMPLCFLGGGVPGQVVLSRLQVASLNALAFFNALPSSADPTWEMPEHLSFRYWLSGAAADGTDSHKARCLMHYFQHIRLQEQPKPATTLTKPPRQQTTQRKSRQQQQTKGKKGADQQKGKGGGAAAGGGGGKSGGDANADDQERVTITRLVLSPRRRGAAAHDAASWMACTEPLQPLIVELSQSVAIEDAKGALQADFANEFIGGGVMCGGNLQEENRFSICPECLVATLICPRMADDEALLLSGVRQYATYIGYGDDFECSGAHPDPSATTSSVLAIDAKPYFGDDRTTKQYEVNDMLRELTKLWVGLSSEGWPPEEAAGRGGSGTSGAGHEAFATGNWGCGAFGGDLALKAMLQWMAASRAGRTVCYYPFGDARADGLTEVSAKLLTAKVTVGQLSKVLFESSAEVLRGGGGAYAVALAALSNQAVT